MKSFHLILTLFLISALLPLSVRAQNTTPCPPGDYDPSCVTNGSNAPTGTTNGSNVPTPKSPVTTLKNPLSNSITSLGGLAQTFTDVISYILILFAVLALIWTGLQYVLAQGNSDRIKELHKQLLAIVIGIAIVIGARVIIQVVINTLSATHTLNPSTLNSINNAAQGN